MKRDIENIKKSTIINSPDAPEFAPWIPPTLLIPLVEKVLIE